MLPAWKDIGCPSYPVGRGDDEPAPWLDAVATPLAVTRASPAGDRLCWANDAFLRLTGLAPDDVRDRDITTLWDASSWDVRGFPTAAGPTEADITLRRRDGVTVPAMVVTAGVAEGGHLRVWGIQETTAAGGDGAPFRALIRDIVTAAAAALGLRADREAARQTLDRVLSSVEDGVMVIDRNQRITHANDRAAKLTGWPADTLIGLDLTDIFTGETGAAIQAAVGRAADRLAVAHGECPWPERRGWLAIQASPSPHGVVLLVTDITARKQEDARRRLILELNDTLRPLHDPDAMLAVAKRLSDQYFAGAESDFATIASIAHDTVLNHLKRGNTLVVGKTDADSEPALLAIPLPENGSFRSAFVLRDRAPRVWSDDDIDLAQRIAEQVWHAVKRVRAERALHDGDRRLRLATQAAALGEWDYDPATETLIRAPLIDRLFGFRPGEAGTGLRPLLDRIHPDDIADMRAALDAALAGRIEWSHEFRVQHPDGRIAWIDSLGEVIRRADGTPERIVGVMRDCTRRREAEQEMCKARDAATEASAAKTRLLAAVSHDLRQPIQAISLFLALLNGKDLAPDARELLTRIDASAAGLQGMLNGLLDIARLDAGILKPEFQVFALDDLLHRLADEFQGQAAAGHLLFEVRPSDALVSSDPVLLEQILRNLLSNALKYTVRGCVLVECTGKTARRIEGGAEGRTEGAIDIHIADTGPGIPDDKIGVIFEDFRQLDNSARDGSRGLGLGLGTVARTAKLLDHAVSVRSTMGEGSVFTVTVPTVRAEMRPLRPERLLRPDPCRLREEYRLTGRHILVVEDDSIVLMALEMMLRDWGLEVRHAHSVAEVAELVPRIDRPIDLVLTDYRLPDGANGAQAVALVRRRWGVPGLIMTGDTAPERQIEALNAGCRLLHKPIRPDDLKRALTALL